MWNYNQEDIKKETAGGSGLNKSGCYVCKIKDIELKNTTNGAKQAIFKLDADGAETTVFFIYSNKAGEDTDFKVRILNHICFLLKTQPKNFLNIKDKTLGFMLKAKLSEDKKFINFDIEGVYDAVSLKTAREVTENLKAETYDKISEKYEKEPALIRDNTAKVETKKEEVAEDEFDDIFK